MIRVSDRCRACACLFAFCIALFGLAGCTSYESPHCLTDDDCEGDSVCWTGTDDHSCVANCTGSNGSSSCTAEEICTQPNTLSEEQGCVPRSEYRSDAGGFDSGGSGGDAARDTTAGG
jgi:hypothetical protein